MHSRIIALALVAVPTGCVSQQQQQKTVGKVLASQRPTSATLRAKIANAARDFLVDPYSVRDAEISDVAMLNPKARIEGICVKGNAKNRMSGYTGRTAVLVQIKGDQLVGTISGYQGCSLPQVRYRRFPELENLKNL